MPMPWAHRWRSGWRPPALHTETSSPRPRRERERGVVPPVPRARRGGRRRARGRMGAGGAGPDRVPRGPGSGDAGACPRRPCGRLEPLGDSRELAFALNVVGWYRVAPRPLRGGGAAPAAGRRDRRAASDARRELAEATMDLAVTLGIPRPVRGRGRTRSRRRTTWRWRSGHAAWLGRIYNNYASIAGNADPRRAVEVLREGLEVSRKAGAWQYVAWITGSLGDFESLLGNLAEAEALQRESIELARAYRRRSARSRCATIALGSILAMRGRVDEARDAYDASGASSLDTTRNRQAEFLRLDLAAVIAQGRGDPAAELAGLRAFADFADESGVVVDWAPEAVPRRRPAGARARRPRAGRALPGAGGPRRSSRRRCAHRA